MISLRKKKKIENHHFQIPPPTVDLLVRKKIVEKEFLPGPSVSLSDYVEVMVYETNSLNTRPIVHVSLFEKQCTKNAFQGLWVICDEKEAKYLDNGNGPVHFLKVGEGRIRFSENPTLKLPLETVSTGEVIG